MSFIADKQTLDDLQLLGKYNSGSIFSLFNRVRTKGGLQLLDQMFLRPMTDVEAINARSAIFRYFCDHPAEFPFENEAITAMVAYLEENREQSPAFSLIRMAKNKTMASLTRDETYEREQEGLHACLLMLRECSRLLRRVEQDDLHKGTPWATWAERAGQVLRHPQAVVFLDMPADHELSLSQAARLRYLVAGAWKEQLLALINATYELDVYIAVGAVAREKDFSFAIAHPRSANFLKATEVRHPRLDKGVPNSFGFSKEGNVLFLTGANMAGKSTLMKASGILLYLAHMGFPVAARELEFSILDGIYSSVNVPDDLNKGYSHFYAEVLRVKKVAEEVSEGKRLFIIFDELFKGTNVKDAYDATLSVTAAFAGFAECFFIISTHIFEVGEALREIPSVRFVFLPTVMEGHVPRYTYKLQEGITTDRQGMIIIENEGILDML
ncbi:MutS-related protein [Chitinophaga sp. 22620]|uniref:MutS-related protein n=1 Tax=Chitinophaga sp. 22620 TaxID=3453952 RepID=UPI003F85EDA4